MIAITEFGSPQSMLLLCAVVATFLFLHKKPHHFFQFVVFMSLAAGSVWLIKRVLQIERPIGGIIVEYGYGFPSGHATMVTLFCLLVVYSYISHIYSKLGKISFAFIFLLFAGLVSYSRVYLGVHTLTDVSGGILLGTFWFLLSIIFYTRLQHNRNK